MPPPPATWGRHPPPETIQPLKGRPETGINASVICPQPIIRFPYAAPFEFLILHRVGLAILGRPLSWGRDASAYASVVSR